MIIQTPTTIKKAPANIHVQPNRLPHSMKAVKTNLEDHFPHEHGRGIRFSPVGRPASPSGSGGTLRPSLWAAAVCPRTAEGRLFLVPCEPEQMRKRSKRPLRGVCTHHCTAQAYYVAVRTTTQVVRIETWFQTQNRPKVTSTPSRMHDGDSCCSSTRAKTEPRPPGSNTWRHAQETAGIKAASADRIRLHN